jgi:hypothetical protein
MGVETLTTEVEPQVNEEQIVDSSEQVVDGSEDKELEVEVVEEPEATNVEDEDYTKAYDKVWEKDIDSVNPDELNAVDEEPEATVDPLQAEDNEQVDMDEAMNVFMAEKPVLKYKGKDVPIETKEELIALAQKGFDYESKMANIKPKNKVLKIVDGIPLEVLQAVSDLNSGKKEAIQFLKDKYGIVDQEPPRKRDEDEVDSLFGEPKEDTEQKPKQEATKSQYVPEIPTEDPVMEFWEEYSKTNTQMAAKVNDIYSELDESFKAEVYKPEVFQSFVASVETGEFETVYPLAIKEKTLNPAMTWLQAYQLAAQKVGSQKEQQTKKPPAEAAPVKDTKSGRDMSVDSIVDRVWNDDEYFKEVERKLFS